MGSLLLKRFPLLSRDSLLNTLRDCGYTFQEILVSPTSVSPNNNQ
jgi:hypothetical protein